MQVVFQKWNMVELVEPLDIEKELQDVLRKVEPDLKDAVKRVSLF